MNFYCQATTCVFVPRRIIFDMDTFKIETEIKASMLEMSHEELLAFAESQEDRSSRAPIELRIFIHFLIFRRTRQKSHIEHAKQLSEGWVPVTTEDDPDRGHREEILNTMSAFLIQSTF